MTGRGELARMMKALTHPVRLQILEMLFAEGEACVCHIEAQLNQRQAYISQQLARLRRAGLVLDRRDGPNVYYGLASPEIGAFIDWSKALAMRMAEAEGRKLVFDPIAVQATACPCPRCSDRSAQPDAWLGA